MVVMAVVVIVVVVAVAVAVAVGVVVVVLVVDQLFFSCAVERGALVRASFCLALWWCGICASFGLAGAFCSDFLLFGVG